jgi:hypothetical protein
VVQNAPTLDHLTMNWFLHLENELLWHLSPHKELVFSRDTLHNIISVDSIPNKEELGPCSRVLRRRICSRAVGSRKYRDDDDPHDDGQQLNCKSHQPLLGINVALGNLSCNTAFELKVIHRKGVGVGSRPTI